MKNLKRLLALASAMALAVSLTACGPNGGASNPSNPAPSSTSSGASAPSEPDAAKPYIEIPAEFQSWDENGQQITRSMLTTADHGMVASLNYVASKIGADILEDGGNAIDAAVAAGFALGVCEPMMSGIGGGGAMTIYDAKTQETVFISFREVSPKNMAADLWVEDAEGNVVGNHKMKGGLSVGVPGEVDGLCYALETYGTMSLEEVIQPAIDLAYQGYVVSPAFVENVCQRRYEIVRKRRRNFVVFRR